jgi:hypothetical protein
MALQKHTALSSHTTLLSTELNALSSGSRTNASAMVDNDNASNRYLFGAFELVCTFGVAPTAGKTLDLYLLPSVDGTNFADGASTVAPSESTYVGSFAVRGVTSAQRLVLAYVALPPTDFKALLVNNSGQSLAASGNTLKLVMSAYEVS